MGINKKCGPPASICFRCWLPVAKVSGVGCWLRPVVDWGLPMWDVLHSAFGYGTVAPQDPEGLDFVEGETCVVGVGAAVGMVEECPHASLPWP